LVSLSLPVNGITSEEEALPIILFWLMSVLFLCSYSPFVLNSFPGFLRKYLPVLNEIIYLVLLVTGILLMWGFSFLAELRYLQFATSY
jgi:hypothetical protein